MNASRAFAGRGKDNKDARSMWTEKIPRGHGLSDLKFWKSHRSPASEEKRQDPDPEPPEPEDEAQRRTTQFSFFSPGLEYAIHAPDLGSLATSQQPVHELLETGELDDVWWLDAIAPSEEDIEWISKVFAIHPLTTEDIGIQETREKIELFGHYYFVSLRSPPFEPQGRRRNGLVHLEPICHCLSWGHYQRHFLSESTCRQCSQSDYGA